MQQDRLSIVKSFLDMAIPVGFGASMAGNAMKHTFDGAVYAVIDNVNIDSVGDDMYQRIYDAANFLSANSTALGTLWGVGCAAILIHSIRKSQKHMANEMALHQMEREIGELLIKEYPQPARPGLLKRILG